MAGRACWSCCVYFFPAHSSAATLMRPPNNFGLVGYWAFNEGTSTRVIDLTGSGNSATLESGVSWTNGKRGKALNFSLAGINTTSSVTLNQGSFSASAWFKTTSSADQKIISNNILYHQLQTINGNLRVCVTSCTAGTTLVNDGNWHFVVVVGDGTSVRAYLDGSTTPEITQTAGSTDMTGTFSIGKTGNGVGAYPFTGTLDEVRLYNRALSQSDISALYRSSQLTMRKVTQQNLLGYWALNERFPSVRVADSSGNANISTVRNSANSWSVGARGGGAILDGSNDYIEIASTNALKYTGGDLSMAFWIKPASDEADGGYIISKPWNSCGNYNYTVTYGSGQAIGIGLNGATSGGLNSVGIAPRDRWSHVVVTVDSSKAMKIYINGVLDNSGTHSITDWTPSGCADTSVALSFATLYPYGEGWGGTTSFSFKGGLDDVRMYSRILSASEVATMYRQSETTIGASQASRGVTNGLQWSYGFDAKEVGTTSVSDMSGNSRTGWLFGGTRPGIGRIGQGIILNGTDGYVDTPSLSFLGDVNGSFTITLWVKPRVTTGTIVHNKNESSGWSTGLIGCVNNKINALIYSNSNLASPNTSVAGEWKYVSLTRDGATGVNRLYEDGVEVNTSTNSYSASGGNHKFTIGRYLPDCCTYNSWFDGTVDEVRLYNRALSAAEIKQLYNMSK